MLLQQMVNFLSVFLVTTLIVRNIPRSKYGELALVLSYGVIFSLVNLSPSSILLRDYPKLSPADISRYKRSFDVFNYYKTIIIIAITVIIWLYFRSKYDNQELIVLLLINTITIIFQCFTDPFQVFLSVSFRQNLITKVILITSMLNCAFTFGVIIFPNVIFVVCKNLAIGIITYLLSMYYFNQYFHQRLKISLKASSSLLLKHLSDFSIWSHLQGIMTDIIYRADILILGWLNTPFQTLGNYNIALQLSNMTKIIPQIMQYHTTLCVSNVDNKEERQNEIVHIFLKINFIISCILMIGYLLTGSFIISIISKTMHEQIFQYGLYILGGLCIFNTMRPLIAYTTVTHSLKQVFFFVHLPAAIFAIAAYFAGGIYYGVQGVLLANIAIGVMLCVLTVYYINTKTNYKWSYSLLTDYERAFLKDFWLKTVANRIEIR
jgi:O-antigen/teichoic acid export membrane protein